MGANVASTGIVVKPDAFQGADPPCQNGSETDKRQLQLRAGRLNVARS